MKHLWTKSMAWVLTIAMVASMLPTAVFATEETGDDGNTNDLATGISYIGANGNTASCDSYTEIGDDYFTSGGSTTLGAGWYVVTGTDVTISSTITVSGDVHLILADGAKLTQSIISWSGNGITISEDASLTIYGQSNQSGELSISVLEHGISMESGADLTINGGTVTVSAASLTSYYGIQATDDNTIEINGGTVDVTGKVGTAIYATSSTVDINGGTVTATVLDDSQYGSTSEGVVLSSSALTIDGGTLTVTSTKKYAISASDSSSSITIENGGKVTATSFSTYSSNYGIYLNGASLTVSGSELTTTGTHGVYARTSATISITDSIVKASGTSYGIYLNSSSSMTIAEGLWYGENGTSAESIDTWNYVTDGDVYTMRATTKTAQYFVATNDAPPDPTVDYIDKNGEEQTTKDTLTALDSSSSTTLSDGWYYIKTDTSSVSLSGLTVTGDVYLILQDNTTLTLSNSITVNGSDSLTIYGQSNQTGKLIITSNSYGINVLNGGELDIYGGDIDITADLSGIYTNSTDTITIRNSTVDITYDSTSTTSAERSGIYLTYAPLEIDDSKVTIKAPYGIYAKNYSNSNSNDVTITNSTVTVETSDIGIYLIGADMTVTDSSTMSVDSTGNYGIYATGNPTIAITNSEIAASGTANGIYLNTGTLTIGDDLWYGGSANGYNYITYSQTTNGTSITTSTAKYFKVSKTDESYNSDTWIGLDSSNIDTFDIDSGMKFYLTESVSNSFTIPTNATIELDLNGYTLTGTVVVQSGATLTITDDYDGDDANNSETVGTITTSVTASYGTVYVNGGSFTLESGTISGCTNTYGGGVYVTGGGTFTLDGGTISGNTATKGGGVYVDNGTFKMVSGTISGNEATTHHGGGVYVSADGSFTMEGATITGNKAGYGAGVYVDGGSFTLTDGTISSNIASGDGGGIYVTDATTLTLTGGTITENEARYGGGIYVEDGTYTLSGSTAITKNGATDGGGIYVEDGSVTVNTTTAISSNEATSGGGIYVAGGSVTLTDGTLTGNTANYGGGVYVNDGAFSITEASITGNSATNNGGGVYVGGGSFTLNATSTGQSVTINNNTKDTDTASNVYLSSASAYITIGGALSGAYSVGVSKYSTINTTEFGFTQDWNTYMSEATSPATFFTPDDDSHVITLGTDSALWILTPDNMSTWLQTQINNSNGTSTDPATITLLTDTMVLNKTITVANGKYVTLTGGTLTRADDFTDIMFTVTGQLTLNNITLDGDSDGTSSYLVSVDGNNDEEYSAQLTLDTGAVLENNGGAAVLVVGKGTLNMEADSAITGNVGSAVILMHYSDETGGNMTMSGGTISGNSALAGSGIYVSASSSLTMTDGTIQNNDAPAATADGWGGVIDVWFRSSSTPSTVNAVDLTSFSAQAVDVDGDDGDDVSGSITIPSHQSSRGGGIYNLGTVTISGGTITGNQAGLGGGVYTGSSATLKLSGAPSITGNFAADGTTANNVYLMNGAVITITDKMTATEANIGITMQTNGTFTSGWSSENTANTTFSSDDSDYEMNIQSDELVLSALVDAPTITTNPSGINTTYGGISGSLTVVATNNTDGATLSYQWYSNTTNSNTDGAVVANATGTTYTIPTTSDVGTYYYYCVVTATLYGISESTTSTVATVVVDKADGTGSVTMADWVHNATASNPVPTSSTNDTNSVTYSYAGRGTTTYGPSETKPTDAGTYTVTATFATTTNYKAVTATANFEITQSAVTSTGLSVDNATPTYGDTVNFTVTPTATGTTPATNGISLTALYETTPTSGQMALYATINNVETQISTAVDADGDGKYTMTYDTTDKLLAVGTHTITAKYVATDNMADYSVTASITISAKVVTAVAVETGITKSYDGTVAVKVDGTIADITFTVPVVTDSNDVVTVTADSAYDDVDVADGITINFTNRVDGGTDKGFYDVTLPTVTGDITALSVAETDLTGTATVVEGNVVFAEPSFVATLVEAGVDPVTEAVTEAVTGDVAYSYNSVDYADYATLITALNLLDFEVDTDIDVTYTFTARDNYTGTKTGTLTLTVTVVEPVYTVNGSTITATYDDAVAGMVSVSAPTSTAVYDGSTAADVSVVKTGIFADEDITITYTKDGVDYNDTLDQAGNYVATITYGDYTATASFTISKAPVSFGVSGTSINKASYAAPIISNDQSLAETIDYTVAYLDDTGVVVDDLSAAEAGTYTIQVTVTNSNYYLSGTVGSVVIYEDVAPTEYTLTYDVAGGTEIAADSGIAGTVHTLPTPTKTGCTFTGWSYDSKIYTAGAEFIQPDDGVTMTAIWVLDSFNVSGTVVDGNGDPVSGATVTLEVGTTDTTDATGAFSFSGVTAGEYDIVASKDGISSTTSITISGDTVISKILLDISIKTAVEVATDLTTTSADLSNVVASLDTNNYTSGDEVEIKLIVASANDTTAEEKIAEASTDVGYVLDLTVKESVKTTTKTMGGEVVETTTVSNLSETADLISVTIDLPAEMQGMAYYTVLRYHDYNDGKGYVVEKLTTSENSADEYIELITTTIPDGEGNDVEVVTAITIHAKFFSTYAVTSSATVPSSGSSSSSTYSSSVATAENGDVSVSSSKNKMNATVTITVEPDDGYEVGDVTVTYSSGREVTVTDNGDGTYSYKQPGASVTVTATFVEIGDSDFFSDVDEDDWFYDAVKWAVDNGVTAGKTDTIFAPYDINTRAEAVTFLWRAMSEPDHGEDCDFTDLDADDFYYEAVLWAVENDITKGTSDTTFSPEMDCTRAQIITFLWRSAGEPVVDSINPFTDVDADSYYYDAVLWAVGAEITEGTSDTTFSPDKDCTRAEIVTFLYRALAE